MGGAIGTVCAPGLFEPQLEGRIQSLVLNDNAPRIADAAVERIRSYAGYAAGVRHGDAELEAFFRMVDRSPMAGSAMHNGAG